MRDDNARRAALQQLIQDDQAGLRPAEHLLGSYTSTFLHAQAMSTWQAMREVGRPCFFLVIDGALDDALVHKVAQLVIQAYNRDWHR